MSTSQLPIKYKAIVEYDGTCFYGFQRQQNLITVQGVLENALAKFNSCHPQVFCAGRTDTGVHATGQVIHFSILRNLWGEKIKAALNYHLKSYAVAIVSAENLGVNNNFHARFDAVKRQYIYKVLVQNYPPVINKNRYLWTKVQPDLNLLNQASQLLVGKHDFSNFRSSQCQAKSPLKTVESINIYHTDNVILIEVTAPSFVHHQIRFMVGAMLEVGYKNQPLSYISHLLTGPSSGEINKPPLAPAHGLYFHKVWY